jgi:hypothetical protein
MCSALHRTAIILALLISSLASVGAHAQEKQRHVYSVKFVCGLNDADLNQTAATAAAGGYKTDINIQRADNSGQGDISVVPNIARSVFSNTRGRGGRSHTTTLIGAEAVKVICQDINGLIGETLTTEFRVGFLQIFSFEPLSVVAVYTAKHCGTTVSSRFLRNVVCDGDVALDVVRYDPVLVEPIEKDGGTGPE